MKDLYYLCKYLIISSAYVNILIFSCLTLLIAFGCCSKTNCAHCEWVKVLLTQLGVGFKVIELDLESECTSWVIFNMSIFILQVIIYYK